METLSLQYFRVSYHHKNGDVVYTHDFSDLNSARRYADWLENCGYVDIQLFVEYI